jgi:hypothetical protein
MVLQGRVAKVLRAWVFPIRWFLCAVQEPSWSRSAATAILGCLGFALTGLSSLELDFICHGQASISQRSPLVILLFVLFAIILGAGGFSFIGVLEFALVRWMIGPTGRRNHPRWVQIVTKFLLLSSMNWLLVVIAINLVEVGSYVAPVPFGRFLVAIKYSIAFYAVFAMPRSIARSAATGVKLFDTPRTC